MTKQHKKHFGKSNDSVKQSHGLWFYGRHAVIAALENPKREVKRLLTTKAGAEMLQSVDCRGLTSELVEADVIARHAPDNAPHQGVALQVRPLPGVSVTDLQNPKLVMVLDQVTDPHNIGAILRSAAAFGVDALIVHEQNSPQETGTMAKAASGALEIVPLIKVANVAQAMDELKEQGFWFLGMDGKAETSLKDTPSYDKTGVVMGAEGKGLRRLTAEKCDLLVKLPIKRTIESLNVSNAAAIALYELSS